MERSWAVALESPEAQPTAGRRDSLDPVFPRWKLVDATFLLPLRRQSGAAATVRAGVQLGQLSASTGVAAVRPALVADDRMGSAGAYRVRVNGGLICCPAFDEFRGQNWDK